MATHSRIPAWEIPWTEEPDGLQSMGSQRLRHDLATKQEQQQITTTKIAINRPQPTKTKENYKKRKLLVSS